MGIFQKSNSDNIQAKPLEYWEEQSYMIIPCNSAEEVINETIFDRISSVDGVTVKTCHMLSSDTPGQAVIDYDGEEYRIAFYPEKFEVPDIRIKEQFFSDEELSALKNREEAVTVFMPFKADSQRSYHLQLKLAVALVPDMVGIYDESEEKLLSPRWVKMAAESRILPSPDSLYTVQAVSGKGTDIWLHTHGLCRCGLSELEILQSNRENIDRHYELISHLASMMINKQTSPDDTEGFYIGKLTGDMPLVVTTRPWTEGLKYYKNLKLGGLNDRENGHNTKTSLIFIYKNEQDEENKVISKITDYDGQWGDNPLLFLSNQETDRMKALARERFGLVKKAFENGMTNVLIKIGLAIDEQYRNDDNDNQKEHIWFELLGFHDDTFRARLIQDPYWIDGIREGWEADFTVNDITDWRIFTEEFPISPEAAYLIAYQ